MARKQKLKVFRTPIGFHDAYVAAPSRKAALAAWGSDADLFARGIAEEVTDDEDLAREPLDNPGKVIRRSRGSAAEQLAALPADRPKSKKTDARQEAAEPKRKPKPKAAPKPRPSRDALNEAEQALDRLAKHQEREDQALREREKAIVQERRALDRTHAQARREAERAVDREREDHAAALNRWIEDQG